MRFSFLVTIFMCACGGTISNVDPDGGSDGSTKDSSPSKDASTTDVAPQLDAGTFCSGPTPKLQINGNDTPILKASGKGIILNCCDSAMLTIATGMFQAPMNVLWRAQAGSSTSIDLSSPPQNFTIEMDLGCDPSMTSCASASPEERYTDGFSGTIDYAYGGNGLTVSYCVHVEESPSQPHALVHSMTVYAPNVASP